MNRNRDIMGTVRRIGIRVALEVLQGVGARNTTNPYANDKVPDNVEESLNFPYINRVGVPLAMDIFKPVGPEYDGKELPVVVSIHGGGLVTGDRKISLKMGREMASRGYLVFAIEYRLAPRATVSEQLDDVCAGMDYVGRKIVEYDVDPTRIFMTADSAGAFLAIYTAAMKKSKKLQDAIGYKPSRMTFKALGLSCGMFYTNRDDILGLVLSEQFYGDKFDDKKFLQYMNPEHPEIINNLPPVFLVTARGDFLNNYTIMFHRALKKAGKTARLLYYGESDLIHTFNFSRPYLPQSKDANDKMVKFFEEQASLARVRQKVLSREKKRTKEIEKEIQAGAFAKKRMWEAVYTMNSEFEDKLDAVAIVDDSRKYTYRQMFRQWRNYAEVFSALHMTEKDGSRVGIAGAMTAEAAAAFYALDMTGAEISVLPRSLLKKAKKFTDIVRNEKLTDLVLTDYEITPGLLRRLAKEKEELGLKNIIVLQTEVDGPCADEEDKQRAMDNRLELRKAEGALFMPELLTKYEATPISSAEKPGSETTILLHKQEEGEQYTSVSFTDSEINALVLDAYAGHKTHRFVGLTLDLYTAHSLAKQLHQPLLLNDSVLMTWKAAYSGKYYRAIEYYHVDTLILYSSLMKRWKDKKEPMNFASLDSVSFEDMGISQEELNAYKAFIEEKGGKADVKEEEIHAKDYSAIVIGEDDAASADRPAVPSFLSVMPPMPYTAGLLPIVGETREAVKARIEQNEALNRRMQRLNRALSVLMSTKDTIKKKREDDAENAEEAESLAADAESDDSEGPGRKLMDVMGVLFEASTVDYYIEK